MPKPRARVQHPQHAPQHLSPPQQPPQPSDYETDAQAFDVQDVQPPPPRSNEELNLAVLRRHYPLVRSIHHVTSYAVLYTFNEAEDKQIWEKVGTEGTLFICELAPSPIGADQFSVVMLNRRGLDNFEMVITSDEDLEITPEYIILNGVNRVYGIWVFSEPPPSSTSEARVETAEKIRALAQQARESKEAVERESQNGAGAAEVAPASVAMGRQLSLRELFGQQREQDSAWSIHNHNPPEGPNPGPGVPPNFNAPHPAPPSNLIDQLFSKARQNYNTGG